MTRQERYTAALQVRDIPLSEVQVFAYLHKLPIQGSKTFWAKGDTKGETCWWTCWGASLVSWGFLKCRNASQTALQDLLQQGKGYNKWSVRCYSDLDIQGWKERFQKQRPRSRFSPGLVQFMWRSLLLPLLPSPPQHTTGHLILQPSLFQ